MAKPNVVTKESLLEAANDCLVENGMQGFTLRAVAKYADVTQGTVYYHFRTKEQLLVDMATHMKEMSLTHLEEKNYLDTVIQVKKSNEKKATFHYKLILMLTVIGFDYPEILEEMNVVSKEQAKNIKRHMVEQWDESPIAHISDDLWGVLIQSLIDGLAYRAVQSDEYTIGELFRAANELLTYISEAKVSEASEEESSDEGSRPMFGLPKKNNLFY